MHAHYHLMCKRCFKAMSKLRCSNITNFKACYSSSRDVRRTFLDFFCTKNGHTFVKSSSVIPGKDQGTYFTNAGMNQFKPIFLGTASKVSDLDYRRVANSQKCIRVGGKHNDLDDVGLDLTHHTFFEMLGSWSFGDYFKNEACRMALELLVNNYQLPLDRLYFTYFCGHSGLGLEPDLECRELWRQLGVREDHILPFGMKDNFWDMGETGPCGPCTEIHFDHIGNRNARELVNTGSPEVVEIWNLVFMQYNRLGADKLLPLPRKHVDTGMGLERLCAVMNGTRSNYNTDLFTPIFHRIHKETGTPPYRDQTGDKDIGGLDTAYRIIADHMRMATVCISDGLLPGRCDLEHRLRHVMYRALYQSHHVLKVQQGLMRKLVKPIAEILGETYPEISNNAEKVIEVVNITEDRYLKLHEEGKKNFEKLLKSNPNLQSLSVEQIHKLHDGYYGKQMSLEMIEIFCKQYEMKVEPVQQQQQCGTPVQGAGDVVYPMLTADLLNNLISKNITTTDDTMKYTFHQAVDEFPSLSGTVVAMVSDKNKLEDTLSCGDKVGILLNQTMFYAEKGGQIGDRGNFKTQTGHMVIENTQSNQGYVLHIGQVIDGHIKVGQLVTMEIDKGHRLGCMRNHTATHLVNAALRRILGSNVSQRGSLVQPDKLTFQFSCFTTITDENIHEISKLVETTIEQGIPVHRQLKPLKKAVQIDGVVYLDNVDYPKDVFVVSSTSLDTDGCQSVELCGGTHVSNTKDIGQFCVTNLTGLSSGTKTVVCLTGKYAEKAHQTGEKVKCMYEELELLVKSKADLATVVTLQKHINQVLGTEVLPKIVKDELLYKMAHIGTDINTALSKQAFEKLKKDLNMWMTGNEDYIVKSFKTKVLPKLNKLMKSTNITKPLILVVETSNNMAAYIAFPHGSEVMKSEVTTRFCETVKGSVVQREHNYELVTFKGGSHVTLFIDAANEILKRSVHGSSLQI